MTPHESAGFGAMAGVFVAVLASVTFFTVFGEDLLIYAALTGKQFIVAEFAIDLTLDDLMTFGWLIGVVGATLVVVALGRLFWS